MNSWYRIYYFEVECFVDLEVLGVSSETLILDILKPADSLDCSQICENFIFSYIALNLKSISP